MRVHFAPAEEADSEIRVAYSVSRKVGSAVVRNRWRRRLRAIAAGAAGELPSGTYLVVLGPEVAGVSFGDLERRVVQTMRRASEPRP